MRKIETFNASRFLAAAREAREDAADFFASNQDGKFIKTIRDAYRFVMDESDYIDVRYVEDRPTAETLRSELIVAAIAAGQYGASAKQIDYIVALCGENEGFEPMGYTVLTSRQASNLINSLKSEA